MARASDLRTSARLVCSLLQAESQSTHRAARGTVPLALPLIRLREVGQFYFGALSRKVGQYSTGVDIVRFLRLRMQKRIVLERPTQVSVAAREKVEVIAEVQSAKIIP